MSLLRNRHVLVALLIAPVLALVAWFSLDLFIGEEPQAARAGQSYPLVELPNCRYNSGRCTLKNEDVVLDMRAKSQANGAWLLRLESAFALDGVKLALARNGAAPETPGDMSADDPGGTAWTASIRFDDPEADRVHVVAAAGGVLYYGDVALKFTLPPENP